MRTLLLPTALAFAAATAAQTPVLLEAETVPAATGGDAALIGLDLDLVTAVLVDGAAAPVVLATPTVLVAAVPPGPPGARELTLIAGVPLVLPGALDRLPRTTAAAYGLGATISVRMDLGAAGGWFLAAGLGTLPAPFPLPGFHHGIELDLAGVFFAVESGTSGTAAPVERSYALPADPALVGTTLFLQSLALPAAPSGAAPSFSDVAAAPLATAGPFRLAGCSLGCASAGPGSPFFCAILFVPVDQPIHLDFPAPIDLASISPASLQILDIMTGLTPAFDVALDPDDPTRLCIAPSITVAPGGQTVFGLTPGKTYQLRVPGINQTPFGPWLTSVGGAPNQDELVCTFTTTPATGGFGPGPPQVAVSVTVATAFDALGIPIHHVDGVPADGSVGVALDAPIVARFSEVVAPGSALAPGTGSSPMEVLLDLDGDPATTGDQSSIAGVFTLALEPCAPGATLAFLATGGLPPGGGTAAVVVRFLPGIVDLGGQPLVDPGAIVFTTLP